MLIYEKRKCDSDIEFTIPQLTKDNKWLFYHPIAMLGWEQSHFFIDKNFYMDILSILNDKEIPKKIIDDLVYCVINMHITLAESEFKVKSKKEDDKEDIEQIKSVKLIDSISKDEVELKNITLDFIRVPRSIDTLCLSGNRSLMLFVSMIKNYTDSNEYNEYKSETMLLDFIKEKEKNIPKNKSYLSSKISLYTSRLFNYVRGNEIFDELSNNQVYIIVGKLMVVSGLDKKYDIENEITLQERIKKRINP